MKEANTLLELVATMDDVKVRSATAYLAPNYTMRLSRVRRHRKNEKNRTWSLTVGGPNFEARKFIKMCRKAGEPFPVKKVQLKFWPKKK